MAQPIFLWLGLPDSARNHKLKSFYMVSIGAHLRILYLFEILTLQAHGNQYTSSTHSAFSGFPQHILVRLGLPDLATNYRLAGFYLVSIGADLTFR